MAKRKSNNDKKYLSTGIPGFDNLFKNGIPKGSSILVAGGAGSGKTNLCLQVLSHHASKGKNCYYMGFKEPINKIMQNMKNFGWNPKKLIDSGNLKIKRFLTSEIYYYDKKSDDDIQAMMTKDVDPLLMELEPLAIDEDVGFKPDIIVLDSLTALSSAFRGKEQSYRFYIERLFRFFEKIGSTNFLITETKQIPDIYSSTGVEEFLADGVIVIYNLRRKNIRKNAIEILKMRGESHQKKIISMQITNKGIEVYPNENVSNILD
jgi:KaiC/GvpD/RAD55 family RecA-like ATPase